LTRIKGTSPTSYHVSSESGGLFSVPNEGGIKGCFLLRSKSIRFSIKKKG